MLSLFRRLSLEQFKGGTGKRTSTTNPVLTRRRSSKSVTSESNVITPTGSEDHCTAQEHRIRTSVINVSPRRDSKDIDRSVPNVDLTIGNSANKRHSMSSASSTTDTKEHSPTHVAMQTHTNISSNVQSRTTRVDNADRYNYAHSDHLHTHADSKIQDSLNCNETSLDSSSIEDSHMTIIENISASDHSNFDCKTCVSHCHEPERHVKFRETLQSDELIVEFPVEDGDCSSNTMDNDIIHSHDINLNTSKRQRHEHKRRHTKSAPQQNRYRKSSDPTVNSGNKRRRPSFQESLV